MLTLLTNLLHIFWKCAKCFWVCCRLFFCNQDLRSWIVAILQDSMPSVLIHLLHTFNIFMFFLGHVCWCPEYCYIFYPGDPELWFHMMHWPVPLSSISSYTLSCLTAPSFLYSSVMYVPWSTLVNYAFQFYHLHCNVLAPGHVIASVSTWNQELLTKLWDVFDNYRSS